MSTNKKFFYNAVSSVIQTIFIGIVYFILYRYIIKLLGAEKLGLWSLIVASTSVANLANLGITGSIVKFISASIANRNPRKTLEVIHTSTLIVGGFMLGIIMIVYALLYFNLHHFVPLKFVAEARILLPLALFTLFLNSIGAIFLSVLDGMELIYLRAFIYIGTSIIFLLSCFYLAPKYFLEGVVYAQIIQGVVILLLSIFSVFRKLKFFTFRKFYYSRETFKELFSYGINFQIISITGLLFDPISKFCLSSFGNLSMVGYFEMASRLIGQLRSLVVSANQAIVPLIARKFESSEKEMNVYYTKTFKVISITSVIIFALLIIYAPLISKLWVGEVDNFFIYAIILLSIGWLANIFSAPAYFINMGTGQLKWNVVSHLILGLSNLLLGILFGVCFGGGAVLISVMIALVSSACTLIIKFNKENKIGFRQIFDKEDLIFYVSTIFVVGLTLILFDVIFYQINYIFYYSVLSAIVGVLLLICFYKIKTLRELLDVLLRTFLKSYVKSVS